MKKVLDVCCGSRMFWFDKCDNRATFGDIRKEQHILCDGRSLEIAPDIEMDFRNIPFDDGSFKLVVFDPPHLTRAGKESWLAKKYGVLGDNWREDLQKGFAECFRVLEPGGTLIFKWCELQVSTSEVLKLTPERPLFGHKSGKRMLTHWITFMKQEAGK